ncbi:MAG: FAD-dependent oxidoreductase [Nitriliruptoraceae bacterium]|nr:FAD-dependent oxidoreductase [Nitriliruptoraceae bacterium]
MVASRDPDDRPHVLVLGAGYAGAHAASAARATGVRVTVVDPDGLHGFLPRLAAVAAGRLRAADAHAPLDALVDVPVLTGVAAHLDVAGRAVHLEDGTRLRYDAAVVTTGGAPASAPVPGVDVHAWQLHTPAHALALRAELRTSDRLVVVGGGATGVQLAAEAATVRPELAVTLVEARDRLLPTEPRHLGRWVTRLLERAGVEVVRGTAVDAVERDLVRLADGTTRRGTVVWAGGWQAEPGRLLPGAALEGGRVVVDADLTVPGHPRVLAAGDLAAHRDVLGRSLAMSAQTALQAGAHAGRTAAAIATGDRPGPARLFELGRVVDLGANGVARIGPLSIGLGPSARLVPWLHRAIDLRHLVKLGGPVVALRHTPSLWPTSTDEPEYGPLRAIG